MDTTFLRKTFTIRAACLHLLALLLVAGVSFAGTKKVESLEESKATIPAAGVSEVVVLGQNRKTDKTYRLLLLDNGQATDVSPRYGFYVTYFHGSEMNNSKTAFYLGEFAELVSSKRVEAGIYEIKAKEISLQTGQQKTVSLMINVHQVALDEKRLSASWEEMSDPYFKSSITLTR